MDGLALSGGDSLNGPLGIVMGSLAANSWRQFNPSASALKIRGSQFIVCAMFLAS
tara:strand:- start:728 stop:892 length:165 start_codon:yes stop_codon:yes gene_type:complete